MRKIFLLLSVIVLALNSCTEDEGELLVTDRTDCYISRMRVRGTDNITIVADATIGKGVDTVACTITAVVKFGTDLTKLKADCSLSPESILEPGPGVPPMGTWVDFTKGPYVYTVVSGNRKNRKAYTVTVTAQQ